MTGLATVSKFFRFLIPTVVVIILIYLIYLRYYSEPAQEKIKSVPSLPPVEQEVNATKPQAYDFTNAKIVKLPKEASTYQATNPPITEDSAQKIASGLGITIKPGFVDKNTIDGTQYDFQEGQKTLTVSNSYLSYDSSEKKQNPDLQFDQLMAKIEEEIGRVEILNKPKVDRTTTKYLKIKDDRYKSAGSYLDATIVEFSLNIEVDGLPIYTTSTDPSQVRVKTRKNGDLISLDARFFRNIQRQNKFPLKDIEQAKNEVRNLKGIVASSVSLDEFNQAVELYSFAPTPTRQLSITTISTAYYLGEKQAVLQPIYVFTGEFSISQTQKGRMIIYLPAISSEI